LKLKRSRLFKKKRIFVLFFYRIKFFMYFCKLRTYKKYNRPKYKPFKYLYSKKHYLKKKIFSLISTNFSLNIISKIFVKLFLRMYSKFKFNLLTYHFGTNITLSYFFSRFYLLRVPITFIYFYLIHIKKIYPISCATFISKQINYNNFQIIFQKLLFLILYKKLIFKFLFYILKNKFIYFIYFFSLLFIKNNNKGLSLNFIQNKYVNNFKILIKNFVYTSFFYINKTIFCTKFNNSIYVKNCSFLFDKCIRYSK